MADAYPELSVAERFARDRVIAALAAFQRSMIGFNSPWDAYLDGDASALDPVQLRGMALFFSPQLACGECHAGRMTSLAFELEPGTTPTADLFRNTGLYNIPGQATRYPEHNVGIVEFTRRAEDEGKHRIPSLRNVAVTGPYMHDGSLATLDAVIDHYAAGGRTICAGPRAGVGSENTNKDPLIAGFELSPGQRNDLIAFLHALSDEQFLEDPRFSDPWTAARGR